MTVNETLDVFFGKPVRDFRHGDQASDPGAVWRLSQDYDDEESQEALLGELLGQVPPASLEALVIGAWSQAQEDSPAGYLEALIARRNELGALRALFVGDMTYEDCEISWIIQTNYAPLVAAFPALETLRIRGAEQLVVPPFEHASLKELAIETGGLPDAIVAGIAQSKLPALTHLELWLGDENYGFGGSIDPYVDLLERIDPSRLSYLGLRNAAISDEIAEYVAQQPWLGQLHTLDLSMGTLGDRGALALAASPHIAGLKRLDVRHHYIGDAAVAKLRALPLELVIDDAEEEDDGDRYVQVAE
jgi:hypothetical protein